MLTLDGLYVPYTAMKLAELKTFAEEVIDFINKFAPQTLCSFHSQPELTQHNQPHTEAFEKLALRLFELQFRYNHPYRRYCEYLRITPNTIQSWQQIPAVPTTAFKDFEMTCLPEEMREHVFFSSGTTSSSRSKHYHCTLSIKLYETSIWNWFLAHVWPMAFEATNPCSNAIVCILTPPPESIPESSLVHMLGLIASRFGNAEFCAQKSTGGYWSPDFTRVIKTFEKAIRLSAPVLTLTPASALVLLLEFMSKHSVSIKLPPCSVIMETGGYKGQVKPVPKSKLYAIVEEVLGVPQNRIVSEYGMCELSSQAYDHAVSCSATEYEGSASPIPSPENRTFHFPPWARAVVISPESGTEVAPDQTGIIKVIDLANVFSVQAIFTGDLGIRTIHGFRLLGRAPTLEPRGCSLMVT